MFHSSKVSWTWLLAEEPFWAQLSCPSQNTACTEHSLLCLISFTALLFSSRPCIFYGCFSLNSLVQPGRNERHRGTGQFSAHLFAVHNYGCGPISHWESGNLSVRKNQGQDLSFTPEGTAAQSKFSFESSLDLESLRSRPGWQHLLPCFVLFPHKVSSAYSTLSKLRQVQPKEMHWEGSLCIFPSRQTGVISIAANSQKSTGELRAAKSWKQQGPRRATSCQWWLELISWSQTSIASTSKERLWHRSLKSSCSITVPENPKGVWHLCWRSAACAQPAAHRLALHDLSMTPECAGCIVPRTPFVTQKQEIKFKTK